MKNRNSKHTGLIFFYLLLALFLNTEKASSADHRKSVEQLYGKKGGIVVEANGMDVCSWDYARLKNLPAPLKPVYADLSSVKAGAVPGTVLIDPVLKKVKFFEGHNEPFKRMHFVDTPHGMAHKPIVSGNFVYMPNGETWKGFQTIDCSDPKNPVMIASLDVGCFGKGSRVLGNRVYATSSYYGVTIIDISNPKNPEKLGRWRIPPPSHHGWSVTPMRIGKKHYFYCMVKPDGNWKDWPKNPKNPVLGMRLVDATDPANCKTVANLGTKFPFFKDIVGHIGYVVNGNRIDCYDLSHPAKPVLKGTYKAPGNIAAIKFTDGRAYAAVSGKGFYILDTNKPADIKVISVAEKNAPRKASSVEVADKTAYVMDNGKLIVYNISDARNPRFVRKISFPQSTPKRIVATGDKAYAIDDHFGFGFFILDISKPLSPKIAGEYPTAGEIQHLLVSGDLGIVSLEWGGMEAIIDLKNPLKAKMIGCYRSGKFDDYADVFIGKYMYFGKGNDDAIVDLSNIQSPREIGRFKIQEKPYLQTRIWNNYGYTVGMLNGKSVISIYNYETASAPKLVSRLPLGTKKIFFSLAVNGKLLFAHGKDILISADISNPSKPRLLGTLEKKDIDIHGYFKWQGSGKRLALGNPGYLYMLQGSEVADDPRIKVFDVRNPAKMKEIYLTPESTPSFQDDWFDSRFLHQGDMFTDFFLRGTYLYVCDYWGGLRIYDIRNIKPELKDWEFTPYLSLVPKDWSRQKYKDAVKSGNIHKYLGITPEKWEKRFEIGRKLWDRELAYYPGYELFGWNVGEIVKGYLVQPKLCGLAIYKVRMSSEKPEGKSSIVHVK